MPKTPCGNSSISPAMARSQPCRRAMPSPSDDHGANFGHVHVDGEAANLLADDLGDLVGFECSLVSSPAATSWSRIFFNCVRTLPSYTVLPIRATTPPMQRGPLSTSNRDLLARGAAKARLEPLRVLRRQRHGGRHVSAGRRSDASSSRSRIDGRELGQQPETPAVRRAARAVCRPVPTPQLLGQRASTMLRRVAVGNARLASTRPSSRMLASSADEGRQFGLHDRRGQPPSGRHRTARVRNDWRTVGSTCQALHLLEIAIDEPRLVGGRVSRCDAIAWRAAPPGRRRAR